MSFVKRLTQKYWISYIDKTLIYRYLNGVFFFDTTQSYAIFDEEFALALCFSSKQRSKNSA